MYVSRDCNEVKTLLDNGQLGGYLSTLRDGNYDDNSLEKFKPFKKSARQRKRHERESSTQNKIT